MLTRLDFSLSSGRWLIAHAGGVLVLISLLMGCNVYIEPDDGNGNGGDGDSPIVCSLVPEGEPAYLRDPATGQCVAFEALHVCQNTGDCVCPPQPLPALPSWGDCSGPCSGLDELTCMDTNDCRAAYSEAEFAGCMATDKSSLPAEDCTGLDAWSCSLYDHCVAIHAVSEQFDLPSNGISVGEFLACGDEPATCLADAECGQGFICHTDDVCTTPPGCDGDGCIGACAGFCLPDPDYQECFGSITCRQLAPECPPGTTPGTRNGCYTNDCVPLDQCGQVPAKTCYGEYGQGLCDLYVECDEGEVPQVEGNCYTGVCIPEFLCEPDPVNASCFGQVECDAEPPICQEGSVPVIADGCFTGQCMALTMCIPWVPSMSCVGEPSCDGLPPACPDAYVPLIEGDCWSDLCAPVEMCP